MLVITHSNRIFPLFPPEQIMDTEKHTCPRFALFRFLLISLTVLVSLPTLSVAEGPTSAQYGVVLNLSGKQRMLSQKMSKEVVLIALNAEKETNVKNLGQTAALFDKTQTGLRDGDSELGLPPTTDGRIRNQLDKIAGIWAEFHAIVQQIVSAGSVTAEQLQAVANQNQVLLKELNKCVLLYEKDASKAGMQSDPGLAVTINLSGKQRMLSQKMSKEFLLVASGYEIEQNKLNLLETYSLFERTLKGLRDGDATLDLPPTKNPDILGQLAKVDALWAEFKPLVAFGAEPGTTTIPIEKVEALAKANLPLLKETNIAVEMYEKEAAR